jgi:hypothetical protein
MRINDDWQLSADGMQWILQRRRSRHRGGWHGVSFVSSTKDILARCMREKGVPPEDAKRVLDSLPDTFKQWRQSHRGHDTGDKTTAPSRK